MDAQSYIDFQRVRIPLLEEEMRQEMLEIERSTRGNILGVMQLGEGWIRLKQLEALDGERRRQLEEDALSNTNRAALSFIRTPQFLESSFKAVRSQVDSEEAFRRESVALSFDRSFVVMHTQRLLCEESKWRVNVMMATANNYQKIFHLLVSERLALESKLESEDRWVIEHAELLRRRTLACRFCSLRLQWFEQWGRLRIRQSARLWCSVLEEYHEIGVTEAHERESIVLLGFPIFQRVRAERIAKATRERKLRVEIQWMESFRHRELERMRKDEIERELYVHEWKLRAIEEQLDKEGETIAGLVEFCSDPVAAQRVVLHRLESLEAILDSACVLPNEKPPALQLLTDRASVQPSDSGSPKSVPEHVLQHVRALSASWGTIL
jgi:hypothetical protein